MADFFFLRDDAPVQEPAVSIESVDEQSNATAVRIEPGDDARALLPFLGRIALVEVNFPAYTDGRGYSAARVLREAGYAGELRAIGDVLVDQVAYMRRCGFDSFKPNHALDDADVAAAFARYDDVYQKTVDARQPIWAKRHEVA